MVYQYFVVLFSFYHYILISNSNIPHLYGLFRSLEAMQISRFVLGKRQDIGGFIHATKIAVQAADMGISG